MFKDEIIGEKNIGLFLLSNRELNFKISEVCFTQNLEFNEKTLKI